MSPKLRTLLMLLLLAVGLAFGQTPLGAPTERPFVPNNRWALVIGASDYSEKIGRLRYTGKEARDFATHLQVNLAFDPENIRLVADGGMPEEDATEKHVAAALDSILSDKRLDKSNLFVFYFSGHGVGTPKGDYLLPSDVERGKETEMGIPVKDVIRRIVEAGLKNVLIIADACRSGEKNDFGFELNELCRKANLAVILGCAPGKRSYEYPSLKQGAFTHFLIQALGDASLRDEAGAVWASAVGEQVRNQVKAFTEKDYGKYAQVPSVWAERSTLDVLLATYLKPPVSDIAVKSLKSSAQKLDRKSYALALSSYAAALLESERYDRAVDLLKVCQQMGELDTPGKFVLASSLMELGRQTEASRTYADLVKTAKGLDRDVAILLDPSALIPLDDRLKSAKRVFEVDDWDYRHLATLCVDRYGDYRDRLAIARRFAESSKGDVRRMEYAKAHLALIEGRWADASKLALSGTKIFDGLPSKDEFAELAKKAAQSSGDPALLQSFYAESKTAEASIGLADLAKGRGDLPARLQHLHEALRQGPNAAQILEIASIAGSSIGEFAPELRTAAEAHPYSWRARMMLALLDLLSGDFDTAMDSVSFADRYADDTVLAKITAFQVLDSVFEESESLGRVPAGSLLTFRRYIFADLVKDADSFGPSPERWAVLVSLAHGSQSSSRLRPLLDQNFDALLKAAPSNFRPMLMMEAINNGWDERAKSLWNPSLFSPIERADPSWAWACYLATQGAWKDAAKMIESLPQPSVNWRPAAEGLRTYVLALSGKKAEAKARLATLSEHPVERAFQGMALAELGDWTRAEPLLREQVDNPYWLFAYISASAMRQLDSHWRASGRLDDARELTLEISLISPGSDLYRTFSLAAKPETSAFVADLSFAVQLAPDLMDPESGTLKWRIDPSGKLTGQYTDATGSHAISGKVDEFGNLSGVWERGGKEWTIAAKIAPPGLYATYEPLVQVGQLIELLGPDGGRIAIQARPKSSSGPPTK